jgi:1-acyl-sn-glycerol-3-phosphate acyltransferase
MSSTTTRRLVSIPLLVLATLLVTIGMPLWLVLGLLVDAVRYALRRVPFMALRLLIFAAVYLWAEVAGLIAAGWILATGRQGSEERFYRVQAAWAQILFRAVKAIFGLRFRAEGVECVAPGPIIVLARHASIVDNLLPAAFITRRAGIRLRYVFKQELLVDPALDVVGNRLRNAFIDRDGDSAQAIRQIADLALGLGSDEGVLLFPEGTRYSPERQGRVMAILEKRSPRLHRLASGLRSVLPPRTGGVLALLESCRSDIVVLAHRGLDGFARLTDIWRGAMVGTNVDVRLWRIGADRIPEDRQARIEWLFELWHEVDGWINLGAPMEEPA